MKPLGYIRNLPFTLIGSDLVETKFEILTVYIKAKKVIKEYLKLAQVHIVNG